jgi:hypothetical protein
MTGIVVALLAVACFTPGLVKGGDLQDFSEFLESRIKSAEAEWKLLSKHFEQEDNVLVIRWQSTMPEKEEYFAIIRLTASSAAAAKYIDQAHALASTGIGVKIQGVGQEAYLSQLNRGASISIKFRERNFVVKLIASSEAKGRRFAKYIIDSIAALKLPFPGNGTRTF